MASIFSHALSGYAISSLNGNISTRLLVAGILATIIPDIDIIAFDFGIAYGDPLGHRGFTHSLLFAVILAVSIKMIFFRSESIISKSSLFTIGFLFVCCASHGLLDAMTNGGKGVGFFIPFDNDRYFLSFRPIQVSPIGASRFFSDWGWKVIKSEVIYIGIPALLLILLSRLFNFRNR
ncbi:MAG: metal-dependent hydrolase [Chitinophagales bacterium]|nr:metal-dependent hydrolase [Chitinophagales bacterium]